MGREVVGDVDSAPKTNRAGSAGHRGGGDRRGLRLGGGARPSDRVIRGRRCRSRIPVRIARRHRSPSKRLSRPRSKRPIWQPSRATRRPLRRGSSPIRPRPRARLTSRRKRTNRRKRANKRKPMQGRASPTEGTPSSRSTPPKPRSATRSCATWTGPGISVLAGAPTSASAWSTSVRSCRGACRGTVSRQSTIPASSRSPRRMLSTPTTCPSSGSRLTVTPAPIPWRS